MDPVKKHFLLRKLHSLSGVVPLGVFLLEHLFVNAMAMNGAEKFDAAVELIESMPFLLALEMGFIMAPLFFHAFYGMFVTYTGSNNVGSYGYIRNYMYALQRVTGVFAFIYVIAHLWDFRVAKALGTIEITSEAVAAHYANPLVLGFNILGVLAVVFHFSNGLWNFLVSWGITVGRFSQRASAAFCCLVGLGLAALGVGSLAAFYQGFH